MLYIAMKVDLQAAIKVDVPLHIVTMCIAFRTALVICLAHCVILNELNNLHDKHGVHLRQRFLDQQKIALTTKGAGKRLRVHAAF